MSYPHAPQRPVPRFWGDGREAAKRRNRTCQKSSSPHGEGPHRLPVLDRDVGPDQVAVDGQVLLLGMAAEQLQPGADDPLLDEERDDLVPEEVGIDPLPNPRGLRGRSVSEGNRCPFRFRRWKSERTPIPSVRDGHRFPPRPSPAGRGGQGSVSVAVWSKLKPKTPPVGAPPVFQTGWAEPPPAAMPR